MHGVQLSRICPAIINLVEVGYIVDALVMKHDSDMDCVTVFQRIYGFRRTRTLPISLAG